MATIQMEAETRTAGTKNDARRVRAAGRVPAILYGAKKKPIALSLDPKPVLAVLHSEGGRNKILNLQIAGGESSSAVLKDFTYDPVSGALLHVDLKRIALDEKLRVKVPIHTVGEAKGVKVQGGILELVLREVEVECLPDNIPLRLMADVSELVVGKNLRVRDLAVDPKVRVVSPPDHVVAHVVVMKEEEEKKPEEAAAVAAAPAEPEVIRKGKPEKEGEGEEAAGSEAKPEAKKAEGKKAEGKEGKKK